MDKYDLMSRDEAIAENRLMRAILEQIQMKQVVAVKVLYVRELMEEAVS